MINSRPPLTVELENSGKGFVGPSTSFLLLPVPSFRHQEVSLVMDDVEEKEDGVEGADENSSTATATREYEVSEG